MGQYHPGGFAHSLIGDNTRPASLPPRHRLPVASSPAHPHSTSLALKIGVEVRTSARQVRQLQVQTGSFQYDRITGPQCAGALSQITLNLPPCLSSNRSKKAKELSLLLFPSSSIHSTSPVFKHSAE